MSQLVHDILLRNLGRTLLRQTEEIAELVRQAVEAETRIMEHRELGDRILARLGILRGPPG